MDWLAQLRDDAHAEPLRPLPDALPAPVPLADEAFSSTPSMGTLPVTQRAVIGDELRLPIVWCEIGFCVSRHADPAALGEADLRSRALATGWVVDALGRLACPACQQRDPRFWTTRPVALREPGRTAPAAARPATAADPATAVRPAAAADRNDVPPAGNGTLPAGRPSGRGSPARGRHRARHGRLAGRRNPAA